MSLKQGVPMISSEAITLLDKGVRVIRISNYEMLMHTETLLNWLWHQLENLDAGKE
ncbi:MAG: hypothetical protein JWO08_307 [Verrucomicrobiaceae bacterium]|nr:hypothetical protein [Verrucomicrobiaceae bacterium]